MAKDPAFLFYSKDWIEGTAEMMPEEKGVFIDLLAHQHQSGSLPTDTKRLALISRLAHEDFLRIWNSGLSKKFNHVDNRLVNHKLIQVVADRVSKAIKNRIIGIFAGLLRKLKIDPETASELKKQFVIDEFIQVPTNELTTWITNWIHKRQPSLGNANGDANTNELLKIELSEKTLEAAEMNQFDHSKKKNTDFIKSQWKIFKLERINDPPIKQKDYIVYPSKLNSHFLNWIRNKFPTNDKRQTGTVGKSIEFDAA